MSVTAITTEFARPGAFVGSTDIDSPWVPWLPGVSIRHLAFDVRTNTATNILHVEQGGMLGRHRHRGPVEGFVLEGSFRYLEYDWVATAGCYVGELPGSIHTLVSDDPKGMKALFRLNGALEFLGENDEVVDTFDVFWFIDHYVSYCRANGLKINGQLWV